MGCASVPQAVSGADKALVGDAFFVHWANVGRIEKTRSEQPSDIADSQINPACSAASNLLPISQYRVEPLGVVEYWLCHSAAAHAIDAVVRWALLTSRLAKD